MLVGFLSCQKNNFNIKNLNGNKITALGHAGMGIGNTYPMNSFESISKCLNAGTDGTEFDVQMTKDGVLVAYHGYDLSEDTDLTGVINSKTWDEVKVAKYKSTLFLNYSIIGLDELFSNIKDLQKYKFSFDTKLYLESENVDQFYEQYITAVIALIEKYEVGENVYIESQSVDFLKKMKSLKPNYKLFIYPESFESGFDIAKSEDLYGITISTRSVTKEQIKQAHDNNLRVAIWNTHSKRDNVEAIRKNPDFIQSDKVKNLVKLLK